MLAKFTSTKPGLITINDPMLVTKSNVSFWDDMEKLGFKISKK